MQFSGSRLQIGHLGRKLEKLSMPVHLQLCAAMDGTTSPDVPGKAHSGRTRHSETNSNRHT